MFGSIFAQTFLNVSGVFRALKIHPPETEGAVDKMNVAIDETRQHEFSAGIDHFCTHAAHALDHRVVTDSDYLAVLNGYGLSPRLLGVFRVNAGVHDDNIRRFDHPALRARERGSAQQERERWKNDAKRESLHRHVAPSIKMLAAC